MDCWPLASLAHGELVGSVGKQQIPGGNDRKNSKYTCNGECNRSKCESNGKGKNRVGFCGLPPFALCANLVGGHLWFHPSDKYKGVARMGHPHFLGLRDLYLL